MGPCNCLPEVVVVEFKGVLATDTMEAIMAANPATAAIFSSPVPIDGATSQLFIDKDENNEDAIYAIKTNLQPLKVQFTGAGWQIGTYSSYMTIRIFGGRPKPGTR